MLYGLLALSTLLGSRKGQSYTVYVFISKQITKRRVYNLRIHISFAECTMASESISRINNGMFYCYWLSKPPNSNDTVRISVYILLKTMADTQLLVNAKGWELLCHWVLFNINTYMAMRAWQSQVTENFILEHSILITVVSSQSVTFV
jgi:hypothetical protein